MPPQTNVYAAALQTPKAKGFLSLFKSKTEPAQGWSTVRTLGHSTRRAVRRPVWE